MVGVLDVCLSLVSCIHSMSKCVFCSMCVNSATPERIPLMFICKMFNSEGIVVGVVDGWVV